VLRTLPGGVRRRLPWRLRHPVRWLSTLVLLCAAVAAALIAALGQTHRGTSTATGGARAGLRVVPLSQQAAHGYNPFGTGPENRDLVPNVVDNDPTTTWSTEQYYEGTLKKASGGTGVGLYLDAAPGVAARALQIKTPTPGFAVLIYASDHFDSALAYGNSTPLAARGWLGPVGASNSVQDGERLTLRSGGHPYRYYLMWMTALPAGRQSAEINELTLLR
jgi:eukaryotic-like serine/threonine-protein kinase